MRERIIEKLIFLSALTQVLVIVLIGFFVFKEGLPVMDKYGVFNFIFGNTWNPFGCSNGNFFS
mgnify:CR=1 FL=1